MAVLSQNNIDVMTIRNTIGYPSTDVGTLCGGVPAAAAKINMYSKYKPVRYPNDNPYTDPDWWQGNDGTCGIEIPRFFISNISNLKGGWVYKPPRGGASEPFRLGDYRGYNHQAPKAIEFITPSRIPYNAGISSFVYGIPIPDGTNIVLSDVFAERLHDMLYFAVRITAPNGAIRYKTTETPFTGLKYDTFININIATDRALSDFATTGIMKVLPFVSSVPLTNWASSFNTQGTAYQMDSEEKEVELYQFIPPVELSFDISGALQTFVRATITIVVTNVSNNNRDFYWSRVTYDKTDSTGNKIYKANANVTIVDGKAVSGTAPTVSLAPGAKTRATITVPGANQIVGIYSMRLVYYFYDPKSGDREMGSLTLSYIPEM